MFQNCFPDAVSAFLSARVVEQMGNAFRRMCVCAERATRIERIAVSVNRNAASPAKTVLVWLRMSVSAMRVTGL